LNLAEGALENGLLELVKIIIFLGCDRAFNYEDLLSLYKILLQDEDDLIKLLSCDAGKVMLFEKFCDSLQCQILFC
jgi:hypothetical protein